ncbi:MAG: acyl-ACP--UDP-N-acetylglucosamine O-acyltransferase [Bradyrhizobiaceae bacterium]|nr:acyl-ACP--UDP-N-acetylglucosamine O-acyltransferase [Bradyrhizobiaceae bacterium]
MGKIDPTARVADGARLGAGVKIGPYCIVGPDVAIGDGCRLIAHVHVTGVTTIGAGTVVYPFASLGTPPQSVHYKGEATRLVIGEQCDLREGVTMNIGTAGGLGETRVGDRCMFMVGAHVGHDCVVGNDVIFANNATLGGHCTVGDFVFFGGLSAAHQFVRIGEQAVIGGMSGLENDVIPFGAALGARAELGGLNIIGMKRRGFSREQMHALRRAYRMLFFGEGALAARVDQVAAEFAGDANVRKIVDFIRAGTKRKIMLPRAGGGDAEP